MSTHVWPQLSDVPAGLTDSRGGVNEASPPSSQKDALLSSKPNKPPPPSSPSNQGQKEVSKVSESAQEALSPTPQKAAPKEQSKTEAPKKKKDPVGENGKALHPSPSLSSPLIVWTMCFLHARSSLLVLNLMSPLSIQHAFISRAVKVAMWGWLFALVLRLSHDRMFTGPVEWGLGGVSQEDALLLELRAERA